MSNPPKSKLKRTLTLSLTGASTLLLLFFLTGAGGGFPVKWNDFLRNLKDKTEAYNDHKPEDRVYLQFDKPFYKPGDDIWFSAYLRDAASLKQSRKSDILHVELINPKGNVQQTHKLVALDGFAKGDFHIDEEFPGGLYKVRAYTKWQDNEAEAFVYEKELQVQKVVLPNLKMKLDFDRKAFGPGDHVTASLDLQTNANRPLANHDFSYVASLDGATLSTLKGSTDAAGKATIKFDLPEALATNDGLVNVLIQYNGLTESVSRSIPIVLNQIDLSFFPEGGDLVEGLDGRVAFRALNEFGKPADIEGVVVDDKGRHVSSFKSYHMGMGSFDFEPLSGRSYTAQITKPEGIAKDYALPEALPRGYALQVDRNDSKELRMIVASTENEALSLVAQVRGEVYWASEVEVTGTARQISIPLDRFPMGVAQVTLFDSKGIERCERLAFVNRDRQLNVDISTNKEKYLPREQVDMTIRVSDDRGMPMPANLSLSVVNDQLLSFADDKSGNILSSLLLEPDLKQKVEEPAFYFKKEEEKSLAALDHLMMTSGWRRFNWEQVLSDRLPPIAHAGERASLGGRVLNGYTGQPVAHASITAPNANMGLLADKNGVFTIDQLDLGIDNMLNIAAENYTASNQPVTDYNQNLVFYLYPTNGGWGFEDDDWGGDEEIAEMAVEEEPAMLEGAGWGDAMGNGGALNEDPPVAAVKVMAGADLDMAAAPAAVPARDRGRRAAGKKMEARNKDIVAFNQPVQLKEEQNVALDQVVADGIEPREHPDEVNQKPQPEIIIAQQDEIMDAEEEKVAMGKIMDNRQEIFWNMDAKADKNAEAGPQFYRAREFAAPVYGTTTSTPANRTDFRSTLYWNPSVKVDRTGKAKLSFFASDEITSFRAIAEGLGRDGSVGRSEHVIFTQLPFSMSARVPTEVATNDRVVVPVTLKNNTSAALSGSLHIIPPAGLVPINKPSSAVTIAAGQAKTLMLAYDVAQKVGESAFEIAFASEGHTDAFKQPFKVVPQGFPVNLSFSGSEKTDSYKFNLKNTVPGSVTATFTAYPNVVSDLVKGIESILREPYGCFEQTSTSSYPNALVMNYMKETDEVDPAIMERARTLLDKGYKRLTTFECSNNGYEWFGSNPPHEALSAYGLMQFNDYQKVYDGVDNTMVDRTAKWLMSRRDGKGGFKRDGKALDSFGRADAEITNAYIVYALSEAGFREIMLEAKTAYDKALSSKDPYQLALVANAMYNLGEKAKADKALAALVKTQQDNGSFKGKKHSITYSQGQSLLVETTSLAVLAMINSGSPDAPKLQKAVEFITGTRSGHGGFGSTQATIMALKSLVEYAKFAKKTDESGTIEVYVDGMKVAEKHYEAGTRDAIEISGLEATLGEGIHTIDVKFKDCKEALPYAVAVDYHTSLPTASPECAVMLKTKLSSKKAKMGETVRLSATLVNTTQEGQPMTMAILGLPAGLSAQPWQLKELQEKKVFDFYEVVGNNIACYYRQMKPGETREINLDLKADVPGRYTAPASSAYLYYTAEYKDWTALPDIEIYN